MSTISHEPSVQIQRPWWIEARNMWASLAITAIWVVVMVTSLVGPDFETVSSGGDRVTVPSGVGIAFFAVLATVAVAKYGFEKKEA